MLKRLITYKDFNGNEVAEEFFFNLSETELIEMEVEYKDGLAAMLQKLIDSKNGKEIISYFQNIVLMSYGQKSEDGKRFIKSDEMRSEFKQTAAFNALFMELAMNDEAGATFVKGILPPELVKGVDEANEKAEALAKSISDAAGAATLPPPVPPVL